MFRKGFIAIFSLCFSVLKLYGQITDTSYITFNNPIYIAQPPADSWEELETQLETYANSHYPEEANYYSVEGSVFLGFGLDAEGKPTDIQVLESPGFALDLIAREALMKAGKWTWEQISDSTGNRILRSSEKEMDTRMQRITNELCEGFFNDSIPFKARQGKLYLLKEQLGLRWDEHLRVVSRSGIILNSTVMSEFDFSLFSLGPRNTQVIKKAFASKGFMKGELVFESGKIRCVKSYYRVLSDPNYLIWVSGEIGELANQQLVFNPFEHRFVVRVDFPAKGNTRYQLNRDQKDSLRKAEHQMIFEYVKAVPKRKRITDQPPVPLCGEKNWRMTWKKYCLEHGIYRYKGWGNRFVHLVFYIDENGEPFDVHKFEQGFHTNITDFITQNSCGWSIPIRQGEPAFQLVHYKLKLPKRKGKPIDKYHPNR